MRVFDIENPFQPREVGYYVPPDPGRLIDPRPNRPLVVQSNDCYVDTNGLMYVTDSNGGLNILEFTGCVSIPAADGRGPATPPGGQHAIATRPVPACSALSWPRRRWRLPAPAQNTVKLAIVAEITGGGAAVGHHVA